MDAIEISPLDFALVAVFCAKRGFVLSQVSNTTIGITRDSMVAFFPGVEDERYYDATVALLRAVTPDVHWMNAGKTDDVGFFTAYDSIHWKVKS
jgi:hypothetical protein